jgi:tetratricopeptide (TPR) repeat protein
MPYISRGPVRRITTVPSRDIAAPRAGRGAEACIERGLALYARGRYPAAVKSLRRAVDIAPDNAAGRYLLGLTYKALGRDDKALEEWRYAVTVAAYDGTSAWAKQMARRLIEQHGPLVDDDASSDDGRLTAGIASRDRRLRSEEIRDTTPLMEGART